MQIPDGLILVVKRDCPTCELVAPTLPEISAAGTTLTVYTQDDPAFPEGAEPVDDTGLEASYTLDIETVPTLIRRENGREIGRAVGWHRGEWQRLTGLETLAEGLPEMRPGCGSKSVEPGMAERLAVRYGGASFAARSIEVGGYEDPVEYCFEHGWSDGLPVVPPTAERVYRMLQGTARDPKEVIGNIPPNMAGCTVEKVAINAVMAGAKPEYMPVILTAVEAALEPEFAMHGLLCSTHFAAPVVVVSGPITRRIGMNWGMNALGQGNRANNTIGRTLQLVVRNVGGGRPGEIDRATLGNPGKHTYICFAEDETDDFWESLAVQRGAPKSSSAVTLFAGESSFGNFDQVSRKPESLCKSLALSLRVVGHPKKAMGSDALIVMSPEHVNVFREAGWSKAQALEALHANLQLAGDELVKGAQGIEEGMPSSVKGKTLPKFRPEGLNIVRAGGPAGKMSAILGGWAKGGPTGSELVTKVIAE